MNGKTAKASLDLTRNRRKNYLGLGVVDLGPSIVADKLVFCYGDLTAVDHVSFEVNPREVLGFLGPNGAGKTTTVKLLTGQLKPKEGKALVLGFDMVSEPKKAAAKIGVCFEEKNLYPRMTAERNLRFFAKLFDTEVDVDRLLSRVGLEGKGEERVENYSKGMKQRLMIARALVNEPDVLFLDEPTDGLDPVSANNIRRVIGEEKERGASILLTTHDMMEADKLSDRVAFINEGRIEALDTPENLKLKYGKRSIKVLPKGASEGEEEEFALDDPETPDRVKTIIREGEFDTIHTTEATLEEIFIEVTGRGL
jgi:ABC-2 type transport system ATP-binding protein